MTDYYFVKQAFQSYFIATTDGVLSPFRLDNRGVAEDLTWLLNLARSNRTTRPVGTMESLLEKEKE